MLELGHACMQLVTSSYALLAASFRLARNSSLYTVFQVVFGLPIAFSTSLEGSAIEMKPAAQFQWIPQ